MLARRYRPAPPAVGAGPGTMGLRSGCDAATGDGPAVADRTASTGRATVAGWVASGAGTAIGSTSQTWAVRSASWSRRAASIEPALRCASRSATSSSGAGRAIGAIRDRTGEPERGDAPHVERGGVSAGGVVQVRPAAGHARPEVRADRSEDDDRAAGHVLAAVRADPLDHRLGAAVADGEAHPCPADEVEPSAGRPVQHGVAGDGLRRRVGREIRLRGDRDRAPGQPLRDIVIGLPDETQLHARPGKGAEGLAGGSDAARAGSAHGARRARGRR